MKKGIFTGLMSLVIGLFAVLPASASTYNGTTVSEEADGKTYNVTASAGDKVTLTNIGSGTGTLAVTFKNGVSGSLVVTESTSRPAGATSDTPGTLNLYYDVSLVGLTNDDVTGAVWTFSVTKAWLSDNGVTAENVFLHHFNGTTWERLTTREISSTDTTVTFEADVTNFSPFAVSAVAGLSNTGSPAVLGAILASGIIAAVAGTFFVSRRAKKFSHIKAQ